MFTILVLTLTVPGHVFQFGSYPALSTCEAWAFELRRQIVVQAANTSVGLDLDSVETRCVSTSDFSARQSPVAQDLDALAALAQAVITTHP